ncbi:flagellar motor switch protein FliM [bacterium]|nr:flagellar motor switch protein FliM [bacterium]
MRNVLSQNEVDALLAAVSEGDFEDGAGGGGHSGEVRNYDLTSQDRIFRGKMPILDVIHEKFCRDFRSTLSLDLGRLANLEPNGISLLKFQEFLNGLPVPSCLSLFKIDPLPGNGVVVVESQFVFTLVDIFCGGSGNSRFRIEGRDFTSIEIGIVRKIVKKALAELGHSWRPVFPVDIGFIRTEINPQFVSIAHPTEVVVNMESLVDVEGATGLMQIVVPYASIEPIRERLSQNYVGDKNEIDRLWKKEIRGHIKDASVELKAEMGTAELSIGKILSLQPGDEIMLDNFVQDAMHVQVEGIPKFRAETGLTRQQSYKALEILDFTE